MKKQRKPRQKQQQPVADRATPRTDYVIRGKTTKQNEYLAAIDKAFVTFSTGPAGVGKTFCAVAKACQHLEEGKVSQIILTRPLQDAEEDKLGILPGEIDDKFGPYIAPMTELLNQFLGRSKVEAYIKAGKIRGIPLALVRGHTFDNAFIIASEMQNSSPKTMKLILTRLGTYTKIILDGDIRQKDISGISGMEDATRTLSGLPGIEFVEFDKSDIVRSGIVRLIVDRYEP